MAVSVAEFFSAADHLPFATLDELVGLGGVLVVAPHPDDESLGCGGLLASCADSGRAAHVVIVSDGTGSHPTSKAYPPSALLDLREGEARAACAALGLRPEQVTFLRMPDRSVPSAGDEADTAIAQLARHADAIDASAICVTWRHDPHCDHQACFALAEAAARHRPACRLLEYPVWGHTNPPETAFAAPPRGRRLDVTAVLDRKRAAIACHRSQITRMIDDDPYGFALPPEMIARFERPFEIYLERA